MNKKRGFGPAMTGARQTSKGPPHACPTDGSDPNGLLEPRRGDSKQGSRWRRDRQPRQSTELTTGTEPSRALVVTESTPPTLSATITGTRVIVRLAFAIGSQAGQCSAGRRAVLLRGGEAARPGERDSSPAQRSSVLRALEDPTAQHPPLLPVVLALFHLFGIQIRRRKQRDRPLGASRRQGTGGPRSWESRTPASHRSGRWCGRRALHRGTQPPSGFPTPRRHNSDENKREHSNPGPSYLSLLLSVDCTVERQSALWRFGGADTASGGGVPPHHRSGGGDDGRTRRSTSPSSWVYPSRSLAWASSTNRGWPPWRSSSPACFVVLGPWLSAQTSPSWGAFVPVESPNIGGGRSHGSCARVWSSRRRRNNGTWNLALQNHQIIRRVYLSEKPPGWCSQSWTEELTAEPPRDDGHFALTRARAWRFRGPRPSLIRRSTAVEAGRMRRRARRPMARSLDAHADSSTAASEAGRHVQKGVAETLGLCAAQLGVEAEKLGPCHRSRAASTRAIQFSFGQTSRNGRFSIPRSLAARIRSSTRAWPR